MTSIGEEAFSYCGISSIIIPKSVTTIGNMAFFECSNLNSVTIPKGVTSIGEGAFSYCSGELVIYGEKGSYAESYAKENKLIFKVK